MMDPFYGLGKTLIFTFQHDMDVYVLTHFFTGIIVRPGEQSIPTGEMGKSPLKRRRNQAINELQNLKYLPRRYFYVMILLHLNVHCTAPRVNNNNHIQKISNYFSNYSEKVIMTNNCSCNFEEIFVYQEGFLKI